MKTLARPLTHCSLCLFVAVFSLTPLRGTAVDDLARANAALATGHASDAIPLYQSILSSPQLAQASAPEFWYNLGLAQEKTGDTVAASLSLRRALLLDPTLAPAQKKLTDILVSLGVPLRRRVGTQIIASVQPDMLVFGGALLGWGGILLLVFFLIIPPRRGSRIVAALLLAILGHLTSVVGTMIDPRRTAADAAVITAKTAPVLRDTPADGGGSLGTLPPGSLITILSRNGSWWYVSGGPGHTGWISSTTVTPLLPATVGL